MKNSTIEPDDDGIRLDRWFKRHYPEISHGAVQKALRKKDIRVDGQRAEASQRLFAGQVLRHPEFTQSEAVERPLSEADKALLRDRVIYQDANLLAINKPAGLATQGGTGQARHVDGLLSALQFDAAERPRLVHRLDKDTSGVLLLARHAKAADVLMKKFSAKETRKTYWALVASTPNPEQGDIRLPLNKLLIGGQERVVVDESDNGKASHTQYRVVERLGNRMSWVECWPLTGRTHQLRVHLAEIGCPIIGDGKYGGDRSFPEGLQFSGRLHLHARRVELPDFFGKNLTIDAPLDGHMQETWDLLGLGGK